MEVSLWSDMSFNSDVCLKGLVNFRECIEDRLSADQDFKQGSPNTKQEYYPFGRSLLFHGIARKTLSGGGGEERQL
jgi:hypothetical protein